MRTPSLGARPRVGLSVALSLMAAAACGPAPQAPVARSQPVQLAPTSEAPEDTSGPLEEALAQLQNATLRAKAIARLRQLFEDAVTRAGDRDAPGVRTVVDSMVEPLTRTYVEHFGDLDSRSRVALIKLLSEFRDARTAPAVKKAFAEFAKQPSTAKEDVDIKWAARAARDARLETVSDELLNAFLKLRTVLERNERSGDRDLRAIDTPLKQILYRIEARRE